MKHDSSWSLAEPQPARVPRTVCTLRGRGRGGTGTQHKPHSLVPVLGHAEKHPWVVSWQAEVQPLRALLRFAQLCGLGPGSQAHFKAVISILHAAISAETPASYSKSIIRKSALLSG